VILPLNITLQLQITSTFYGTLGLIFVFNHLSQANISILSTL